MKSTYSTYYKHFVAFFLLSGFSPFNNHLVPRVTKISYFFSFFHYKRLRHPKDFNYLSFVLLSSLCSKRFQLKTTIKEKFPRYIFKIVFDKQSNIFAAYERFVFFNYAFYHTNAIQTEYNSNNRFLVFSKGYRAPETSLFRPGARYTENIYDLRQKSMIQFRIAPFFQTTLFGKRALLRLLNLPLQNRH